MVGATRIGSAANGQLSENAIRPYHNLELTYKLYQLNKMTH